MEPFLILFLFKLFQAFPPPTSHQVRERKYMTDRILAVTYFGYDSRPVATYIYIIVLFHINNSFALV